MKKIKNLKEVYKSVFHGNFKDLIEYSATKFNSSPAFIIKHKNSKDVTYENISYTDLRNEINWVGTAMVKRGLVNCNIAIMGKNRYEWMLAYLATLCGNCNAVPLDKLLPEDEAISSLNRSYAKVLIFDKEMLPLVERIRSENLTQVETFIAMEHIEEYLSLPKLREEGKVLMDGGNTSYINIEVDGKSPSIILFTSGTTSMSKAVLLSQENITSNIYSMLKVEDFRHGDVNMAFLPYHHTFGSTGQIAMLASGVTTTFCDGLKYVQKNIVEYKVSIFICVPILIEAIYKKILLGIKKQGKESAFTKGLKLSAALRKIGIDKRRKIFKDIHQQLGGNLRLIISGASALDPKAHKGLSDIGILTLQGYGMTEASPVLTAENPKERSLGSIGLPIPGVELALDQVDEDGVGELIAKGPNIMHGYFQNEDATAEVMRDGWLHTGDLAYLDKKGFIHLCGRKKNVIVLKNGKNVFPEEIENQLSHLPYLDEVMVYGDTRDEWDTEATVLGVKIVYKGDVMETLVPSLDPEKVQEIVKRDIDKLNESLPSYKHLARLIVTDQPMIKTTTGKIKRFEELKKIRHEGAAN